MNIIGEGFPEPISKQVIQRQKIYGSGYVDGTSRSHENILYLNANTSWCKLVSSVNIDDVTLLQNQSITGIENIKGNGLAKRFVLFNGTDNEAFYYGRMADELIRYNRIKSFIFKPQAYLSFGQIKYNLRDNEIIILQDLLTQEFFENLIPSEINRFAKYNTYDTAEPILSQQYNNELELDEIINPNHVRDCVKSEPNKIKSGFWRKCFPNSFREIEYTGSNFC